MKVGLIGQNVKLEKLYKKYFNKIGIKVEKIDISFSYYPKSFKDIDLSFDIKGKYYNEFVASCTRDNRVSWRFFREDVEYLYFIFKSHSKEIIKKFDAIYFINVPHEGYDIVLAEVVEEYNKNWFASYQVPTKPLGICLYSNGFKKLDINNEKKYEYWKKPIYFDENTYKKNLKNLNDEQSNIPSNVSIIEKMYSRFVQKKRKFEHLNFMKRITKYNIIISNPACVFFLHYQPELTTEPFCSKYANQLKMIEYVMNSAKKNNHKINFYLKEHPVPSNIWRGEFFNNFLIQIIRKYDLKVIDISTNKILENKNNIGIVTLTGTVGYEAIFHRKSVLCCKSSYYNDVPDVYTFDKTELFLNSIVSSQTRKTSSLIDSVNLKNVFEGVCDPYYVSHDYLNEELKDGIKSIVENIERKLND